MKNLLITKSSDFKSALVSGQTYNTTVKLEKRMAGKNVKTLTRRRDNYACDQAWSERRVY